MAKQKKKSKKHVQPKAVFSFRRNLLPVIIGLLMMVAVFVMLNGQWLMAQAKYRLAKPSPAAIAAVTKSSQQPAPEAPPTIIIPRIGTKAPIIFEPSTSEWAIQLALRKGVDHYGSTVNPGQPGNTVLFGHSSGQLWAPGDYKFVFTLLDKLQLNDQIIIDYKGTRYVYTVNSSEVILPTNLSVLNQGGTKPTLTLITCTPVGTSKNRLVIHAEQTSPAPNTAGPAPQVTPVVKAQPRLPGSAHASFWQSLTSWL